MRQQYNTSLLISEVQGMYRKLFLHGSKWALYPY
jgi:hypothetical protein